MCTKPSCSAKNPQPTTNPINIPVSPFACADEGCDGCPSMFTKVQIRFHGYEHVLLALQMCFFCSIGCCMKPWRAVGNSTGRFM